MAYLGPESEPNPDRKPTTLCPGCRHVTWTGGLCLRCEEAAGE